MSADRVNTELIVANYTRNQYENKYNKQHIPMALKYIIIAFAKKILGCDMLTFKEDLDFFRLLSTKISSRMKRCRILYKASDNEYSAAKFHQLCDGKGPSITIIKSNFGNIFGGYTSKKWPSINAKENYVKDDKAFLFLIRSNDTIQQSQCPQSFDIIDEDRNAITSCKGYGPLFGDWYDIKIDDECNLGGNYTYPSQFACPQNISGSDDRTAESQFTETQYWFDVVDYYVIQID